MQQSSANQKQLLVPFFSLILFVSSACAYAAPSVDDLEVNFGFEQFSLPDHEKMGMGRIGVRKAATSNLKIGVTGYTAMTGERGGFITIGVDGEYSFPLTQNLDLEFGLFVGAGGGKGGAQLAGGGLMLRENLGIGYKLGKLGKLSVGVSQVDFPENGKISSTQAYLAYSYAFKGLFESGFEGPPTWTSNRRDIEFSTKRHEISAIARQLRMNHHTHNDTGGPQADFSMIGTEWRTYLDDYCFLKAETSAAMNGNSAGYMQILAGGGLRLPLTNNLALSTSLTLGGGGGGGVDAAGGLMWDAALSLQYRLTNHWFIDLGADYLGASSGSFKAIAGTARLGYQFGLDANPNHFANHEQIWIGHPLRLRWAEQQYSGNSTNWRNQPNKDVGNLGVQVDYFLTPNWFVTGQGLGAYAGNAGAYMTGLMGLGGHFPMESTKLFVEAEALFGAAGGGGLAVGSGLVYQGNISLGYQFTPSLSLLGTIGTIKSADGNFSAKVAGISVGYQFRMFSPSN